MVCLKKRKTVILGLLVLPFLVTLASAEVLYLKDGTTVQGDIVGANFEEYTVRSASLGEVKIKKANVNSFNKSPAANTNAFNSASALNMAGAPQAAANMGGADVQAVQAKIMADPAMLAEIQALANDPEVVQLISDPAFMQAVQTRNMSALQSNPRMSKLMSNPKIQALIARLQAANVQ